MYICDRFFLCMIILRGRKRFFYKDSLVVFTHKFVNLRRRRCVKILPFFFYAQSPDFHKLGLCYNLKILYL